MYELLCLDPFLRVLCSFGGKPDPLPLISGEDVENMISLLADVMVGEAAVPKGSNVSSTSSMWGLEG